MNAVAARVRMYCTRVCPYCWRAESLLQAKGAQVEKIHLDSEPDGWARMMASTGRRTVPQIYIDAHHVGGYEDLVALDRCGELDALLAGTA